MSRPKAEVMDFGNFAKQSYAAAPSAAPSSSTQSKSAASARAAPAAAKAPSSSSSTAAHKSSHVTPSAASSALTASSHASSANHWLSNEPTVLGVDIASDRPLYCLSVNERNNSFVVGGADHSLRVYDLKTGAQRRELYSKTSGHTEWVTCCASLKDGRVLSGGMDSQLYLWASSGPNGIRLSGHQASVSKLMVDDRDIAFSIGYDKCIRAWNLGLRTPKEVNTMRGHGSPLTAMDFYGSLLVSGARDGVVGLWDVNTGQNVNWLKSSSTGQVLSLQFGSVEAGESASQNINTSGGAKNTQEYEWLLASCSGDGFLRLYDLRSEAPVFSKRLSAGNPGSVNEVAFARGYIVAALADGHASVLDSRMSFETVAHLMGHRAPIQTVKIPSNNPEVVCTAASNGWFMVHDLARIGEKQVPAQYALGLTTAGGINAMHVAGDRVVTAGDDGQASILQY